MPTTENIDSEKARLLQGFPTALHQDVQEALKILPLDHEVHLIDGKTHRLDNLLSSDQYTVVFDGEVLSIPARVYFNEPPADKLAQLTARQQRILHCVYLRHHDGFVRQRHLMQLLRSTDYFVIPYTLQLLGEYVLEIMEVLGAHLAGEALPAYVKFVGENPGYWRKTQARVISYWYVYYRWPRFPKLKNYPGQQLVDRINAGLKLG